LNERDSARFHLTKRIGHAGVCAGGGWHQTVLVSGQVAVSQLQLLRGTKTRFTQEQKFELSPTFRTARVHQGVERPFEDPVYVRKGNL
jgi:RNA:NAD 2'-phosphotransferase (TPT1/KptA family)